MKLKNILVPVDFSPFSDMAVEYALSLAEKFEAKVVLAHAIVLFNEEPYEEAFLKAYEREVKLKEKETNDLFIPISEKASERGVEVSSEILRGFSAADAILELIATSEYDLVVMGTHGRTGLKKWIYGSVAEKVVRMSPVPVLTVHNEMSEFNLERILVPVDFSDYSKKAVEAAVALAREFDATLQFLYVVPQDFHPAWFAGGVATTFKLDVELRERAAERLMEFTGETGVHASYAVLEGIPHSEIVNFARALNVDMVVMGTRGLTGLEHFVVGSTTERVVRLADKPVLTVGREFIDSDDVKNEAEEALNN